MCGWACPSAPARRTCSSCSGFPKPTPPGGWTGRSPPTGPRPRSSPQSPPTPSSPEQSAPRMSFSGTGGGRQGRRPLADDAEGVLRGAAVLAARIMGRLAARPSAHLLAVEQVLGLADADEADLATLARELGVPLDGRAAVIGFVAGGAHPRVADVLALSA